MAKLVRHKLEPSNPSNSYIVISTNQMSKYMGLQEVILKKRMQLEWFVSVIIFYILKHLRNRISNRLLLT